MHRRKWSAFDHAGFIGLMDPKWKPSHWNCMACKDWDSVNGCWRKRLTAKVCDEIFDNDDPDPYGEDVYYFDEHNEDDPYGLEDDPF